MARTELSGAGQARSGKVISALVLDDDDFDRQRLCRIGRNSGLEISIESVPSIAEMEQRLDAADFDLVLIDYRLNEGNGIDAVDVVRRHNRNNAAATVMISGEAATDVAVAAMRHGCDDFLDKNDLTPEVFKARMVAALDRVMAIGAAQVSQAMSPERLREAFVAAFDTATVQQILTPALRPMLRDALTEALRNTNIVGSLQREKELVTLIEGMILPDTFVF